MWQQVLSEPEHYVVVLDNDQTCIADTRNQGPDGDLIWIDVPALGDSQGVRELLDALKIRWEHV